MKEAEADYEKNNYSKKLVFPEEWLVCENYWQKDNLLLRNDIKEEVLLSIFKLFFIIFLVKTGISKKYGKRIVHEKSLLGKGPQLEAEDECGKNEENSL